MGMRQGPGLESQLPHPLWDLGKTQLPHQFHGESSQLHFPPSHGSRGVPSIFQPLPRVFQAPTFPFLLFHDPRACSLELKEQRLENGSQTTM